MHRTTIIMIPFVTLLACGDAASDAPKMRPGEWSHTQTVKLDEPSDNSSPTTKQAEALAGLNDALSDLSNLAADARICVDDAIQEKFSVIGGPQTEDNCAAKSITRVLGGYQIGLTCSADRVTSNISIKVRGDLSSAFTSDVAVQSGRDNSVQIIGTARHSFRYLGPCTGGMKPGDIQIKGLPRLRMEDGYARAF